MTAISVLMGTYNEKNRQHVALAIDSILEQTFQDFEFIICDDGSKWEFYQWLEEYCRKDERIHLLRNECNHGLACVLNRCLRHASGKYIARMDADDISEKKRLAKQYAFLEANPEYVLAGCCARLIGERGVWGVRRLEEKPEKTSFLKTSPYIHPTIFIRRDVIEAFGGYSEEKWTMRVEDYDFFMRLYAAGGRGYNLQELLFRYREEQRSYRKRKYRYRVNECMVRFRGFQRLGILNGNFRYVVKPLLAGLIPAGVMGKMRRCRYASDHEKGPPIRAGRKV